MHAIPFPSIPPNSNPYHHDLYHVGMAAGKDIEIMGDLSLNGEDNCSYLIIVDRTTGQRLLVIIDNEKAMKKLDLAQMCFGILGNEAIDYVPRDC